MSYRAYVENDWSAMQYRIYILDRSGDSEYLIDGKGVMHPHSPATIVDPEHALAVVPHDAAHALLGALARTLGAVEHPEQLRADYMAERKRVDRFIEHLTRSTEGSA